MALLLECTEIKDCVPVYNKALKRFEKYGLFDELEMDTVTWQLVNSLKIRVALKLLFMME
jgi:excinuclease UvrABC nuclease subunit